MNTFYMRERERERETDRQTDRQTDQKKVSLSVRKTAVTIFCCFIFLKREKYI